MTFKEYFNLWEAKQRLDPTLNELISKFTNEVLSLYEFKTAGEGHLNCAWVTQAFCNFCKENKISCKAIMFGWPTEEVVKKLKDNKTLPTYYDDQGESHIAPVVNNTIIDFAIGQFYPQEEIRLTPLDKWQEVYGKFGYGTNKIKGITHLVDTYEKIEKWIKSVSGGAGMNPVAPSLKGKLSERVNNYVKENFADGKKPGRKGLAKRSGVNTKASVSSLRKTARNSTGEKQRMAHWMANMKAGKEK